MSSNVPSISVETNHSVSTGLTVTPDEESSETHPPNLPKDPQLSTHTPSPPQNATEANEVALKVESDDSNVANNLNDANDANTANSANNASIANEVVLKIESPDHNDASHTVDIPDIQVSISPDDETNAPQAPPREFSTPQRRSSDSFLDTNWKGLQINTSRGSHGGGSVPPSPIDSFDHTRTDDNLLTHSYHESHDHTVSTTDSDSDATFPSVADGINFNDDDISKYTSMLKSIYLCDLNSFSDRYLKSGLTSQVAASRLSKYGPNSLNMNRRIIPMWMRLLWSQTMTVMNLVLFVAAVLSAVVQDFVDMVVILVIICANIAIGFLQEFKSESTMAKLKDLTAPMSKVLRDGKKVTIPSTSIVVGDIVLLKEGDRIPADLRICESVNLSCHEAILTGESIPIEKVTTPLIINMKPGDTFHTLPESERQSRDTLDSMDSVSISITPSNEPSPKGKKSRKSPKSPGSDTIPLGDRFNMAYMSTTVTTGKGRGIVIATGTKTEIGKIAKSMGDKKQKTTPLQRKLNMMGLVLMLAAIFALIVVVVSVWLHHGADQIFPKALIVGVTVAVAIIPESLVAVVTLTMSVGVRKMVKQNAIVRKLAALETLGSIQHICSDKTGTLTEGKMVVNTIWTPSSTYSVETQILSEEIKGSVTNIATQEQLTDSNAPENVKNLLFIASLCTSSSINLVEELPQAAKDSKIRALAKRARRRLARTRLFSRIARLLPESSEKPVVCKKYLAMVGEPTELALTSLSIVSRFTKDSEIVNRTYSGMITEFPFNSTIKRMSVIYRVSSATAHVLVKGASEGVLDLCSRIMKDGSGEVHDLSVEDKNHILTNIDDIASRGLRVLCLAYKPISIHETMAPQLKRESFETDLVFVGLVGIQDPPRPEVAESMRICEEAGIVVHMLTGDHYLTAKAISEQVGILKTKQTNKQPINGIAVYSNLHAASQSPISQNAPSESVRNSDLVMEAKKFDTLTPEELKAKPFLPFVIARCSPQSKVKMIEALHARKKLVAMTGDGVNDAPSIKLADIGIAMGKGGSDVTKEAADIILTDDKFSTIVSAIQEGRRIFANIRKFVVHLLSANVAQLFILLIPVVLGYEVPLNPTQILWLNMVTGTPPALSLGVEKASKKVMKRARGNSLFNLETICDLMFYGLSMATVTLLCYFLLGELWMDREIKSGQTTSFTVLTIMLMFHSYNCRHKRKRFWESEAHKSFYLHASVAGSLLLQLFVLYVPWVNSTIFHQKGLDWVEWLFVIIGTICFMGSAEFWKATKSLCSQSKWAMFRFLRKKKAVRRREAAPQIVIMS